MPLRPRLPSEGARHGLNLDLGWLQPVRVRAEPELNLTGGGAEERWLGSEIFLETEYRSSTISHLSQW